MIRIHRGQEPAQLGQVRTVELPRVRAIAKHHAPTSDEIGAEYQHVRTDLRRMQFCKCCYCEHECLLQYNDVEHYRPKARADRGLGQPTHGYWWLAWNWDNLMFACPGCNRSGKNDLFPLDHGSVPLVPENQPPGGERPLLIDPASEDPVQHIQFQRIVKNGKPLWIPVARGGSARGFETIKIVDLGRPDLLDLYEKHVRDEVIPAIEAVRNEINKIGATPQQVSDQWRSRIAPLVERTRRFAALAFDVIDDAFPLAERQQRGLTLLRP